MVVSPSSEDVQIPLNRAADRPTPTIHIDWQRACSILKPTFSLSFSMCFFHVLFGLYLFFDLQPQNLMPLSIHDHPLSSAYDHAQLICSSIKPNIKIFLSLSCTPHIALTSDLPVLHKIYISISFRCHASLPQ